MKKKYNMKKIWSKKNDEFAAKYFFRVCSFPFSYILINSTNITPNVITFIGLVFGLLSILFFSMGTFENLFLGTLFAFLFSLFDNIDGDIARVKGLKSKFGQWFDGIAGAVIVPFIIFSIAYGLHTRTAMIAGALAMVSFPLHFSIVYSFKLFFSENKDDSLMISKKGLVGGLVRKFRTVYGGALFFLLLVVFMAFKRPYELLVFQAIVGNLFWIAILFLEFTKVRKLDD